LLKHRFWEIATATIEDLAFVLLSSREPDRVGLLVCLIEVGDSAADKGKAGEHYEKFLDLLKDADPGIAEVTNAKKQVAALQNQ